VRETAGVDCTLLQPLSEDQRRDLLANARRRRFARREVIFHEGDVGDSIHIVVKGHVGIRATTPLGDVATLRVLGPDEFFGELALLDSAPRSATAFAIDPAETVAISRNAFDDLRARSPAAQDALVSALAAEIRRLAGALVDALYAPVDKRLWRRLLDLTGVFGPGQSDAPRTIPLTQEELAQLTGTTRPTVNRALRDAEAAGVIVVRRGSIDIVDLDWIRRRSR
jgi:CRP/FNR family cyclic AMP-dependent transcriptional regulator